MSYKKKNIAKQLVLDIETPDRRAEPDRRVALKYDGEKPKMSLVPNLALEEVAKVMTYGAKKYAAYNWMNGFDWTRLTDAAMRHINAFNRGEDVDAESGLSHLAHAACCVMMLFDITQLYPEKDNRWNGWKERQQQLEQANILQEVVLEQVKKSKKTKKG